MTQRIRSARWFYPAHAPHDNGQPSMSRSCSSSEYPTEVASEQLVSESCQKIQPRPRSSKKPVRSMQSSTDEHRPQDIGHAASSCAWPSSERPCRVDAELQTPGSLSPGHALHGSPSSSRKMLSSRHDRGVDAALWHSAHASGHLTSRSSL